MSLFRFYFLSFSVYLLITSALYSQIDILNEAMIDCNNDFFNALERGDTNGIFKNQRSKNTYTQEFDPTSVVDSIMVINSHGDLVKYYYTYDSNGNITQRLFKDWDGSNWVNTSQQTYTYDLNNNMTLRLYEGWNSNNWLNQWRDTYTYNSNENWTFIQSDQWIGNEWIARIQYIYSYDSNGNMTSYIERHPDSTMYQIENRSRVTYSYDSNGNMIFSFEEIWNDNLWTNYVQKTYGYNSNGNIDFSLEEVWNNNLWVNHERNTYGYNSNGNLTFSIEEVWNNNLWVNHERNTYDYNSNGNLTFSIEKVWDESLWVNYKRNTYDYDSNENITFELYERGDGSNWINSNRTTYTYDLFENMILKLYENWDESNWVNRWQNIYAYDSKGNMSNGSSESWGGGSWSSYAGGTISFYDSFGRKHSFSGSEINVFYSILTDVDQTYFGVSAYSIKQNYPNPFNPTTTIEYQIQNDSFVNLVVYNALGQVVLTLVNEHQTIGKYTVQFNASNLPSGVYFYKIESGSFNKANKMLLLR